MAENRKKLSSEIKESLKSAESYVLRMQTANRWLLIISILASAGTTLVTGITAAQGPIIGEGPTGWQISCIIGAVLGFITTVCIAINQQFQVGDRLSKANECAGRLKSLEVSITTGSREWKDIVSEYEAIIREYPKAIRQE